MKTKLRYFFTVAMSPPPPSFWSSGGSANHVPLAMPLTGRIVRHPSLTNQPFFGKALNASLTPTNLSDGRFTPSNRSS